MNDSSDHPARLCPLGVSLPAPESTEALCAWLRRASECGFELAELRGAIAGDRPDALALPIAWVAVPLWMTGPAPLELQLRAALAEAERWGAGGCRLVLCRDPDVSLADREPWGRPRGPAGTLDEVAEALREMRFAAEERSTLLALDPAEVAGRVSPTDLRNLIDEVNSWVVGAALRVSGQNLSADLDALTVLRQRVQVVHCSRGGSTDEAPSPMVDGSISNAGAGTTWDSSRRRVSDVLRAIRFDGVVFLDARSLRREQWNEWCNLW